MFKACIKCCYETLAEILNKMAFPNLGLCSGRSALSLHGRSADSHRMLPLSTSGSQWQRVSLLPCQPAPSAACVALLLAACARKVCTELADTLTIQGRMGTGEGTTRDSSHVKTFPGLTMGLGGVPFC